MKNLSKIISASLAFGLVAAQAQEETRDCASVSAVITTEILADRDEILNIVSKQLSQSPNCACEGVKAAIIASKASRDLVGEIVEAAILAVPDQSSLIAQCAIATAPDAIAEIHAVLAKLDPNSGDSYETAKSSKDAKSGKDGFVGPADEETWNPLDFPGGTPFGDIGLNRFFFYPNRTQDLVTDPDPFSIILNNFPNIYFQQ